MIDRNRHQKWHQVATVRRRESLSLRNVSARMGIPVSQLEPLENEYHDLPISLIYSWAHGLRVPVADILLDDQLDDRSLVTPGIRDRARMVRVMKTVEAILVETGDTGISLLVKNLRSQLLEIMPELDAVTSWPRVGKRRYGDDCGRIALDVFHVPSEIDLDS